MAKGVTIQLDVPRKLRFDGEALLRLEEITGMTVFEVCQQFRPKSEEDDSLSDAEKAEARATHFSFKLVVQIAQAGLTDELPHATTKDIIGLMDKNGKGEGAIGRVFSYTTKVFAALSEATGSDPKNVQADLEKKIAAAEAASETLGREKTSKKKTPVGTGTPSSV